MVSFCGQGVLGGRYRGLGRAYWAFWEGRRMSELRIMEFTWQSEAISMFLIVDRR